MSAVSNNKERVPELCFTSEWMDEVLIWRNDLYDCPGDHSMIGQSGRRIGTFFALNGLATLAAIETVVY